MAAFRVIFMKTTKTEILQAALTVFSAKGYEGALMRDISDSLGITKPALYKHYESKEALWQAMIAMVESYYREHMAAVSLSIPESWEAFRAQVWRQIDFTMHDTTVRKMRRLLTLEQFRNEKMALLASKHFLTDNEARFRTLLAGMMSSGLMKTGDAAFLAYEFTAPITLLIHLCDREPDKEGTALQRMQAHIRCFEEMYRREA